MLVADDNAWISDKGQVFVQDLEVQFLGDENLTISLVDILDAIKGIIEKPLNKALTVAAAETGPAAPLVAEVATRAILSLFTSSVEFAVTQFVEFDGGCPAP